MKLSKDDPSGTRKEKTVKEKKSRLTRLSAGELGEKDEPVFQKLRALRAEIAREEKVPPYIVFSDKTLVHMCMIKPKDQEAMLTVTGVGKYKFEKYGERFLEIFRES